MPRAELSGLALNTYCENRGEGNPTTDLCRRCSKRATGGPALSQAALSKLTSLACAYMPAATGLSVGASHPSYAEVYPRYKCDLCGCFLSSRDD